MAALVDFHFLRKNELLFELSVRGGEFLSSADVPALLDALRRVKDKECVRLPDKHPLLSESPVVCEAARLEFADLFSDFGSDGGFSKHQVRRLTARLLHYVQRIEYFQQFHPAVKFGLPLDQLRAEFMTYVDRLSPQTDEMPALSNAPLPTDQFRSAFKPLKLLHPLQQFAESVAPFGVRDVFTAVEFLKFLVRAKDYAELYGIPDSQLLEVIMARSSDDVLHIIRSVKGNTDPVTALHETVLRTFIPRRHLHKLVQEYYLRPQALGETFSDYIARVKLFARVLRQSDTESQVCDIILTGLAPDVRSALMFCSRPTTFKDLEELRPMLAEQNVSNLVVVADVSHPPPFSVQKELRNSSRVAPPRDMFRSNGACFRCGSTMHQVRQCPVPRGERRGVSVPSGRREQPRPT